MLRKTILKLNQVYRSWLYLLIGGLIAAAIILSTAYPLKSQTAPSSNPTQEVKEELVDLEQLSEIVNKIESKWEKGYESYFERDFSNQSRSAKQIAEHLAEISEQTGIKPAVIWAMPQPDFLELVLVTPNNQLVLKEVRSADLETLTKIVQQLDTAISDRQSRTYLPPAKLIYRWIFEPLESYLEAENIDTLLLCTGPMLRSLPFAALHDGEKFVIEKYNLALIPAFNLTDTSYEKKSEQQVLAMGASKFRDLPALPGVEVELSAIVPKLWSGRKIFNEGFTVKNLKTLLQQGKFDIVHLATHSKFRSGSPDSSFIQFGDRKLSLDQIASLNLNNPQVDLLVLSGCETALGDKDAELGFAGLAMQAGVKSALASLWTISDTGTVVLMSEFYQKLKSTPIKAKALRQAQIAMLKKEVFVQEREIRGSQFPVSLPSTITETEAQNLDHPFYWAGFTLIGNPW